MWDAYGAACAQECELPFSCGYNLLVEFCYKSRRIHKDAYFCASVASRNRGSVIFVVQTMHRDVNFQIPSDLFL